MKQADMVVVEGVGGFRVPLDRRSRYRRPRVRIESAGRARRRHAPRLHQPCVAERRGHRRARVAARRAGSRTSIDPNMLFPAENIEAIRLRLDSQYNAPLLGVDSPPRAAGCADGDDYIIDTSLLLDTLALRQRGPVIHRYLRHEKDHHMTQLQTAANITAQRPSAAANAGALARRRYRRALRPAVQRPAVSRADRASRTFRCQHGSALHAAVDQDRRLPGRLRVLPAVVASRHRPEGRKADGRRRSAEGRRNRQGERRDAFLHGRGVAQSEGPASGTDRRHDSRREGDGSGNLRDARHAGRRIRRRVCAMPGSITTTTTSIHRRSSTARSSRRARIRIVSTRSNTSAMPASTCAAAGLSAWVNRGVNAPG